MIVAPTFLYMMLWVMCLLSCDEKSVAVRVMAVVLDGNGN